jgi:hypothetical protein
MKPISVAALQIHGAVTPGQSIAAVARPQYRLRPALDASASRFYEVHMNCAYRFSVMIAVSRGTAARGEGMRVG